MMKPNRLTLSLALLALFAGIAHSQQAPASLNQGAAPASYSDTAEGLRSLLSDARAAAKTTDTGKLVSFVTDMDIPDYNRWFTRTYGKEKGRSWAEPYGRNLDQNHAKMRDLLTKFAAEEGDILTRRVNDAPQGGTGGFEWGLVHAAKHPLRIYHAEWRATAGSDKGPEFIGFFMFIDGKFRWDSNIAVVSTVRVPVTEAPPPENSSRDAADSAGEEVFRPGRDGVGYASCLYCPNPGMTPAAKDAKVQGVVLLQIVIGSDGRARDIQIIRKLGYGLDESAVQAVQGWRFKPALKNGDPVAVSTDIEVAFRSH